MMEEIVVDTNVLVIANGTKDSDLSCTSACIVELERIRKSCRVLVDGKHIFREYHEHLGTSKNGPGKEFLIWLMRQGSSRRVVVKITHHNERGYEQFPYRNKKELKKFDHNDRKFVAVAVARETDGYPRPTIVNASDKGWWQHRNALKKDVCLCFLCKCN